MSAAVGGDGRGFIVGVSLKLYIGLAQSVEWAASLARLVSGHPAAADVELFAAPSFPALLPVRDALRGSGVQLAAQNVFWEDSGPYTGEVGAGQLAEAGCTIVEIGHAERRRIFGETEEIVAAKYAAARRHGLRPLVCVGEAEHSTAGEAARDVVAQLGAILPPESGADGRRTSPALIAYEPFWAIGQAEPAPPDHIAAVVDEVSGWARDSGRDVRVLYGGSAGLGLLTELVSRSSAVAGLFLGRRAHDPAAVIAVIDEASLLGR